MNPVFAAEPDIGGSLPFIKIGDYVIFLPQGVPTGGLKAVEALVRFLVSLLLFGGIILALIFLIIGGIRWITSAGDKEATARAKGTVTYALVGLVLLILSFIILGIIQVFLGVSLGLPLIPQPQPPYFPQPTLPRTKPTPF